MSSPKRSRLIIALSLCLSALGCEVLVGLSDKTIGEGQTGGAGADAAGGTAGSGGDSGEGTGGSGAGGSGASGTGGTGATGAGDPCSTPGECSTGNCSPDGVCCDASCTGECEACVEAATGVPDGSCAAVIQGQQDDTCDSGANVACNGATGTGSCSAVVGEPCPSGSTDCANGQCVDGYCCDVACAGTCEACNLAGSLGTCAFVSSGDQESAIECPTDQLCDGQGGCAKLPIVLASGQGNPSGMAIDGVDVYWVNSVQSTGSVMRVAKTGGTPTEIVGNQDQPYRVAVDATDVYWTTRTGGTVAKAPLGGGGVTVIASGLTGPMGLALNATDVFWTEHEGKKIRSAPIGGGAYVTIATPTYDPPWVGIDASYVYWGDAALYRSPLSGGATELIVTDNVGEVAIEATEVFWGRGGGLPAIRKAPLTPSAVATTIGQASLPVGIATDATHVYWADIGLNEIRRVPKNGGATEVVAANQAGAHAIALDANYIFWTNSLDGTVMKLAR